MIPLSYRDGALALAWLAEAFGFIELRRMTAPDGQLTHAEMTTPGGGLIMLATPTPAYEGPPKLVRERRPAGGHALE